YDACFPRAEAAIVYLDRFELAAMPDDATRLLEMLCSLALVSYVVEVWQQTLPIDTGSARIDRISEPRPERRESRGTPTWVTSWTGRLPSSQAVRTASVERRSRRS